MRSYGYLKARKLPDFMQSDLLARVIGLRAVKGPPPGKCDPFAAQGVFASDTLWAVKNCRF